MNGTFLLLPILTPFVLAILSTLIPARVKGARSLLLLAGTAANMVFALMIFGKTLDFSIPWGGFGIDLSFRAYEFSWFILSAASVLTFLLTIYTVVFLKGKPEAGKFSIYMLLTAGAVSGAVLSNNLVMMLFFWEGLLVLLYAMILAGGRDSFRTSIKAVVLVGVSDLCLMLGIGMTGFLAGTFAMDRISAIPLDGAGLFAFVFLMIGAIGKAGSMPFHSWIPDAAKDAPLPFMALMPGVIEKLLGIYLLARICLDWFAFLPGSAMSVVMMSIGGATILFAVMMALIQKDFKRLLSYHAISQVGYMILGIGTALPIGIVGGLFHMVNNALYKSGLFLTGGAVERQAGTTDLRELGGIGRKMPVTFGSFLILAASISGVPLLNGFYSKELIFDGAMESGWIFFAIAALGAFFTMASFLKLGHAVFLGKSSADRANVREAPAAMLAPMVLIAAVCVLFGVWNALPLKGLIEPVLGERVESGGFSGLLPHDLTIFAISFGVLVLAFLNHLYGVKKSGKGVGAVDHIHHAPGLRSVYGLAEKGAFDPYGIGMKIVGGFSVVAMWIDRRIDDLYEKVFPATANALASVLKRPYNGNNRFNIAWSLGGIALIVLIVILATM